jgi:hypothetical protein
MIMPSESLAELRELESWLRAAVQQKKQLPAPPAELVVGSAQGLVDQLEKLAELHRTGALTDDEFAALKKKLLEI